MIQTPYLLFLGDAPDPLAAKVAQGIRDWRPEYALGQFRMEGCKADMKLPEMTLTEAKAAGCKTLVIGVANRGGVISPAWKKVLVQALQEGFDLASGLHNLLRDEPDLAAVAAATSRTCTNHREPPMKAGHKAAATILLTMALIVAGSMDSNPMRLPRQPLSTIRSISGPRSAPSSPSSSVAQPALALV